MIKAKGKVVTQEIKDSFEGKKVLYKNYITNICDFVCHKPTKHSGSVSIGNVGALYVNCWWDKDEKGNNKERYPIEVNKEDVYELMFQVDNIIYENQGEFVNPFYPVKWTQWGKCFKNKEVSTGKTVLAHISKVDGGDGPYIAKMIPFSKKEYTEEDMIAFGGYAISSNDEYPDIYKTLKDWQNEGK